MDSRRQDDDSRFTRADYLSDQRHGGQPVASSSKQPIYAAPALVAPRPRPARGPCSPESAASSSSARMGSSAGYASSLARFPIPPLTLPSSPTGPLTRPASQSRYAPHSMELQPLPSLPGSTMSASPSYRSDARPFSPPLQLVGTPDVPSDCATDDDIETASEMSTGDIGILETDREVPSGKPDEHELGPRSVPRNGYTPASGRWWRKIFPGSWACRFLIITLILETLVDLAIEGNILWRFNREVNSSDSSQLILENRRRLPIYLVIFGLAHLWQLILAVVCVRSRNTVQVVALTAFNFAFLGYAVVEIYELRQILGDDLADSLQDSDIDNNESLLTLPLNVLTDVVIAVIAVCCIVLVILCYFLRREFGMQRYRFLGADLSIRQLYLRFQVFECVCYFSAFFCAGFGIQFIWLVLQKTDVEYIITETVFPLSVLLLVIGRFAAKYESRLAMAGFMIGLVAGCSYFVYKLVRIWEQDQTTYQNLTKSLTVFAILSLTSLGACFVGGAVCWHGFGRGLKEAGELSAIVVASLPLLEMCEEVTGMRVSEEEGMRGRGEEGEEGKRGRGGRGRRGEEREEGKRGRRRRRRRRGRGRRKAGKDEEEETGEEEKEDSSYR